MWAEHGNRIQYSCACLFCIHEVVRIGTFPGAVNVHRGSRDTEKWALSVLIMEQQQPWRPVPVRLVGDMATGLLSGNPNPTQACFQGRAKITTPAPQLLVQLGLESGLQNMVPLSLLEDSNLGPIM